MWLGLLITTAAAGLYDTEALAMPVSAQGHGPIYGLSTPTLGRGGWSLDVGAMSRLLDGTGTLMLRPMVSYGMTEDLQASVSVPVPVRSPGSAPDIRGWSRMPVVPDLGLMLGWRFHRNALGVGTRFESTLWGGVEVPLDSERGSVETLPGLFGAIVTGYASRSVYAWVGGGYRRYAGSGGPTPSRIGDVAIASLVLGYRPSTFRREYPYPDWRMFVEVVAEWIGSDVLDGQRQPRTGGEQVFIGPTLLGLYGFWGISGGPVFPVYQDWNGSQPKDRIRLAVNATFWW